MANIFRGTLVVWLAAGCDAQLPDRRQECCEGTPQASAHVAYGYALGNASAALKILETRCFSCHGSGGVAAGGLGNITDIASLVAGGFIVDGNAAVSPLATRLESAENPMPPQPAARLLPSEIQVIKDFINTSVADAGAIQPRPQQRDNLSLRGEREIVLTDFQGANSRSVRYVSLVHLFNAGQSQDRLTEHQNSLSRTLNSLSSRQDLHLPDIVNKEGTILRFDLRELGWSEQDWEQLTLAYPYRELHFTGNQRVEIRRRGVRGELLVRGDWLSFHATQPRAYHDLLNLPNNLSQLERNLSFDVSRNIQDQAAGRRANVALRAGFLKSGVSLSNRMIERHGTRLGGFWLSYDFAVQTIGTDDRFTDDSNLFARPLGPNNSRLSFRHAGGEAIFHLPNGLFAYLLADRVGRRIDIAPTNIVSDPRRPDGITNGGACMTCHSNGLIAKNDEIRNSARRLRQISGSELRQIENLYVASDVFTQSLEKDNTRYRDSLHLASLDRKQLSLSLTSLTDSYSEFVTLAAAASEFGVSPAQFLDLLRTRAPSFVNNQLVPLTNEGGQISRAIYESVIDELTRSVF